jgi:hypothetical protein
MEPSEPAGSCVMCWGLLLFCFVLADGLRLRLSVMDQGEAACGLKAYVTHTESGTALCAVCPC